MRAPPSGSSREGSVALQAKAGKVTVVSAVIPAGRCRFIQDSNQTITEQTIHEGKIKVERFRAFDCNNMQQGNNNAATYKTLFIADDSVIYLLLHVKSVRLSPVLVQSQVSRRREASWPWLCRLES